MEIKETETSLFQFPPKHQPHLSWQPLSQHLSLCCSLPNTGHRIHGPSQLVRKLFRIMKPNLFGFPSFYMCSRYLYFIHKYHHYLSKFSTCCYKVVPSIFSLFKYLYVVLITNVIFIVSFFSLITVSKKCLFYCFSFNQLACGLID